MKTISGWFHDIARQARVDFPQKPIASLHDPSETDDWALVGQRLFGVSTGLRSRFSRRD